MARTRLWGPFPEQVLSCPAYCCVCTAATAVHPMVSYVGIPIYTSDIKLLMYLLYNDRIWLQIRITCIISFFSLFLCARRGSRGAHKQRGTSRIIWYHTYSVYSSSTWCTSTAVSIYCCWLPWPFPPMRLSYTSTEYMVYFQPRQLVWHLHTDCSKRCTSSRTFCAVCIISDDTMW